MVHGALRNTQFLRLVVAWSFLIIGVAGTLFEWSTMQILFVFTYLACVRPNMSSSKHMCVVWCRHAFNKHANTPAGRPVA